MIIAQGRRHRHSPADLRHYPHLQKAIAAGIVVVNIDNKLDRLRLEAEGIQIPLLTRQPKAKLPATTWQRSSCRR